MGLPILSPGRRSRIGHGRRTHKSSNHEKASRDYHKPMNKQAIIPMARTNSHKTVIDDAKTPTDKDMESDEAVWALYERWCKAFKKQRDHAEMARRFKIFKCRAEYVHDWNTYVPEDPEEAAIHLQKRREAKLLLSKGEDVSHFDEWHVPYQLGLLADGGDPFLRGCDYNLLKLIEASEACSAVKDVIVE